VFTLSARGLPQARLAIVGMSADSGIRVTTDDLRELRVLVTVPAAALLHLDGATTSFELVVRDPASGQETARTAHFQRPTASGPARLPSGHQRQGDGRSP
jgi:hypothetical protein